MSSSRDRATPQSLAEEVLKVVGDADSDTARTALDIASLLLGHRDRACIEFEKQCITDERGRI